MKILIISDTWSPQINGVVRTLEAIEEELGLLGHEVLVSAPKLDNQLLLAAPFYPEIKLDFFARKRVARLFESWQPDAIHIATEGPLGWTARNLCLKQRRPFTTSYHTAFPEYLAKHSPKLLEKLVSKIAYFVLRKFHAPAAAIMVATSTIQKILVEHSFPEEKMVQWAGGVNTAMFRPYGKRASSYQNLLRPILLNVGRVSIEKNIEAFLKLRTSGSIVVIGEGSDLNKLKQKYPKAHFLGSMSGETLAIHYSDADVFVFPSKTDTFGLVLLEACAAGLRIAAHPVQGPIDIFGSEITQKFSVMDDDLQKAVDRALLHPTNAKAARFFAIRHSWARSAAEFLSHLKNGKRQNF